MEKYKTGKTYIFLAAALWSVGGLLIKYLSWNAMSIIGARSALAALVLVVSLRKSKLKINASIAVGGLCVSLTTVFFVFANKLTTAANAIVLQYTSPVFIIIFLALFLKQRPRKLDILAAGIVLSGMILFFLDKLSGGAMLGNILAILSGVTFAGVFLINTFPGSSPEDSLLLGHLINAAVGLPFLFFETDFSGSAIGAILTLGIFQLGLAYVFFLKGIKSTPSFTASLIATAEPILNPVWVMIFYKEVPGVFALVGSIVVIAAITGYNIITARQDKITK